ncbi:MAG: RNA-binding protein [Planctomycetes bacterium]|nr:RNA-binding protein [Planctomycetota bacterium]
MDICIGNLPQDVTARDLREIFEFFGRVETAHLVRPRLGEESQGLGFVGMPAREEAVSAVLGVHGKTVKGQAITANEVQSRGPVSGVCGSRCSCRSENAASDDTYHISAEFHQQGAGHDAGKRRRA